TLYREGLLLGESLKSPAADRHQRWASVTVGVVDQFENCYEKVLQLGVTDLTLATQPSFVAGRKGGGIYEPEDAGEQTTPLQPGFRTPAGAPAGYEGDGKPGAENRK